MFMSSAISVGIVAIGRNEGERLERCLRKAVRYELPLVYVDSVSTDESVARARALGVEVVELDPSRPLSAARGRNAGFRRLLEIAADLEYVQFIDGDCELVDGWIEDAIGRLSAEEALGGVCGRRLERFPAASIYNRLIDLEWDTPIGPTMVFGGDVMIRTDVFREVNGYDETLIAGEDPDLAGRIRAADRTIERLDIEMTVHDADLSRFGQWWRRQVRAGHAAVDAWFRAPWSDTRIQHRVVSIAFWGGALPFLVVATLPLSPFGLALLLGYPILALRIYRRMRGNGRSPRDAALYAGSCVEGKFAEFYGGLQCVANHLRKTTPKLIEYK
jgi:GT2 family glycosyltransferase